MASFPKVTIEEIIDGPRPVRSRSLSRVAGVGTSKKGKYGEFIMFGDDDGLEKKIGRTTDAGSVGMQCALDEGATDMAFVRVMGAARKASKSFRVLGSATDGDQIVVTISKGATSYEFTVDVSAAATALELAATIASQINAEAACPLMATPDTSIPGTVLLSAKVAGLSGNTIKFAVDQVTDNNGFTFSVAGGAAAADVPETSLSGGFNGPVAAQATSGDLKLVAAYEGVAGNTIAYKFVPGTKAGTVVLSLEDSDGVKESFTLSFTAADLVNGTELKVLRSSNLVRGHFTGEDIASAVLPSGTSSLAGGEDGSAIEVDDYLDALRVLKKNQANIIFAPGQTDDSIRAMLLAQAGNSTILGGLRVAILNADSGITSGNAADASTGYDSSDGSAIMVAGWCTYAGQPKLAEKSVSPDGFYAGHMAATKSYVSVAARSSSPYFQTVLATDVDSDDVTFEAITLAKMDAIVLDVATGGYHCLNGRTLASDGAQYYSCIRRKANEIKTDLFFAAQSLKSEPKRAALLSAIDAMVNIYLDGLAKVGEINGGKSTATVKTTTGVRNDFRWEPVYPADSIDFGMHRDAFEA